MINEELKIKALLAQGKRPRDIVEMDDITISYPTIVKYRNELREEAEKAKVEQVTHIDPVALQVIVDNIPADGEIDMVEEMQAVVDGVGSLASLDIKFHTTLEKLLSRAGDLLDDEKLTPTGLKTISSALTETYGALHAKGTSITMNQNNVSGTELSAFKSVAR